MAIQPWLDGFEHVDLDYIAGDSPDIGRPYDDLSRPKVCLHTTEGDTIAGAETAFRRTPPHMACEFEGLIRRQYLPLTSSSFSLRGNENDDEFIVQVEIVGHAENGPFFWEEELAWIGTDVLAPIWRAGVQFELSTVPQGFHAGTEGITPFLATADSPIRFASERDLRAFSGVMGHQHAPRPDEHWDPGGMNVARIVESCARALGTAPPPTPTSPTTLHGGTTPTASAVGQLRWPPLSKSTRGNLPIHTRIVQQVTGAKVDGDYFIGTAQSVRGFQSTHGLERSGRVETETGTAIIQNILRDKGFGATIDGDYGLVTTEAVTKFQQSVGLEAHGSFDGHATEALWIAMGQP